MSTESKYDRRAILQASVAGLSSLALMRLVRAQQGTVEQATKRESTRFQVACMTLPYSQYPLARALDGIKAAGFRYVALYLSHKEAGESKAIPILPPDGSLAKAKEIGQRCRDAGLEP